MSDKDLLKRLSMLGFPLFEVEEAQDTNMTLADVIKSKEIRLWEGFPVILANSIEKGMFNEDAVKSYLNKQAERSCLTSLIVMALALYKILNLKLSWISKFYRSLSEKSKKEFNGYFKKLKNNEDFKIAGRIMSSQRLKSIFNNYFNQEQSRLSDLLCMKEELSLECAMSCIFSPKQKELFLKELKREKLTKTEKEYFSRVVKKKILALANQELQRMARKLLE
jgi:AAA+ ATPase superfamily predicted ATPase